MKRGMLWHTDGKPLHEAIKAAVRYFKRRYTADANTCYVNAAQLETLGKQDGWRVYGVRVAGKPWVLEDHLQIGVENGGSYGEET